MYLSLFLRFMQSSESNYFFTCNKNKAVVLSFVKQTGEVINEIRTLYYLALQYIFQFF